ncbi:glycoside hydrolase family 43 protein [Parabacteroides pacaensis]|nr:glycoside hydrolase 43 family protein [Parabacteroides pacaensis]
MNKLLIVISMLVLGSNYGFSQEGTTWGNWRFWGEQTDGTYKNPIIPSDYSDIDCIRVGEDYYAISSTFQFSPGMVILHSKDLINWRICSHAIDDLTQISPELNWNKMNRYGRGVWAGSIRYHNERFYIYFGTPDEGYFMTSSPSAEGPWESLHPLLQESGWDDCSALWDEKGNGYFVGTHFADGYKTYLFKLSKDGKSIDRKSAVLINSGSGREANKLIKVNGWYYLIFSEHKQDKGRYVMAKRSKKLSGPYKEEKQLALPGREAMEPNQGGIVEGKDGNWYFFTHHGTGDWPGRIASLLPVTWIDGWPIIGRLLSGNIGSMQWTAVMPNQEETKFHMQRSDDFDNTQLFPQWEWNYQPRKEMYSLTERQGWLRLKAFQPLKTNELMYAGNILTQRSFQTFRNEVIIKMDISGMEDGQKCGLCHFSQPYSYLGVVQQGGKRRMEYNQNSETLEGEMIDTSYIWLKSEWGLDGKSLYSYSTDGENYTPFGDPYVLSWGNYRGDRIGIFCFNNAREKGYVDIDYCHYRIEK